MLAETTHIEGGPRRVVSIIVPVYNEYYQIADVIDRVIEAPLPLQVEKDIVIIDDGSTDGTAEILRRFDDTQCVRVYTSESKAGKGSAIRTALRYVAGDVVVIQDGDREYNPNEIQDLVAPILDGTAKIVYGSRFLGEISGMRLEHLIVNKLLVWMVKLLYGATITDEATAYKAFQGSVLPSLSLNCRRFEFCPEVTAKVLRSGHLIHEVPITYSARTRAEGKKIRVWDAVEAFWTLMRYRFWTPSPPTMADGSHALHRSLR